MSNYNPYSAEELRKRTAARMQQQPDPWREAVLREQAAIGQAKPAYGPMGPPEPGMLSRVGSLAKGAVRGALSPVAWGLEPTELSREQDLNVYLDAERKRQLKSGGPLAATPEPTPQAAPAPIPPTYRAPPVPQMARATEDQAQALGDLSPRDISRGGRGTFNVLSEGGMPPQPQGRYAKSPEEEEISQRWRGVREEVLGRLARSGGRLGGGDITKAAISMALAKRESEDLARYRERVMQQSAEERRLAVESRKANTDATRLGLAERNVAIAERKEGQDVIDKFIGTKFKDNPDMADRFRQFIARRASQVAQDGTTMDFTKLNPVDRLDFLETAAKEFPVVDRANRATGVFNQVRPTYAQEGNLQLKPGSEARPITMADVGGAFHPTQGLSVREALGTMFSGRDPNTIVTLADGTQKSVQRLLEDARDPVSGAITPESRLAIEEALRAAQPDLMKGETPAQAERRKRIAQRSAFYEHPDDIANEQLATGVSPGQAALGLAGTAAAGAYLKRAGLGQAASNVGSYLSRSRRFFNRRNGG